MSILYHIGIYIYYFLVLIASVWNKKAAKWIQGRRDIHKNLRKRQGKSGQTIWFHCASVGEFEQAVPLIEQCEKYFPDDEILVTFFSSSGFEYAQQKFPQRWVSYLPLDTAVHVRHFVEKVQPAMVFIVKYEFWYQLLRILTNKGIPVFLVSGIFRKEQLFFKPWGGFYRNMLSFFTHLFVQEAESARLLHTIGINQVSITGDTRFDRVIENRSTTFTDPVIGHFVSTQKIFIGGSVWNSDIPLLESIINKLPNDWKIILAPHEPGHFDTGWIKEPVDRYTATQFPENRLLLIDTIGLLSKLYRFARFAYVGGGFGKGIHNILEPAVFGIPVLIGPRYHKFQEAIELTRRACVLPVKPENVAGVIDHSIFNEAERTSIADRLASYMAENANVSEKIMVFVKRIREGA